MFLTVNSWLVFYALANVREDERYNVTGAEHRPLINKYSEQV